MDADSLLLSLELASGSGQGLSPDRRASLLTSLMLVKRDYRFARVLFWGRILGLVADYYIAQGLSEDQLAPRKTLYSLNCTEWSLLPPATEEMVIQTAVVSGRFMGDPSHEYEHTELQKVNEGDKVFDEEVVVQIKEETRLVSIIDQIDKAVAIIPRGALFKTPFGVTHVNRTFEGLSLSEVKKLSSYFHFREAIDLKNKTLLEKSDLEPSLDFLDSLEYDIPRVYPCCWAWASHLSLCSPSTGSKSGSLPWSWIWPFQPSHPGYTQPGLSCLRLEILSSMGQTQQLGSPPTRHGSTHQQLGRPLRWRPEMAQLQLGPRVSHLS
ncbi:radial spoke head protein 9 homolog isoform X2 [Arvicanthis niloticus]|uniref:radial spoke head protein 9 homolog isoform X2 n=1 Tax=Arvicanthis niloticus TaxID=61156 RepID=UPI00402BEB95